MKKVSIIIPVYNAEVFLRKCMDSVVNQTYNNLEIICINDGSNDSSKEILEEYAEIDSRILLLNKKNNGVSSARNDGLEICSGDYIMFLDADDYLEKDAVMFCMNLLKRNDIDIIRMNFKKKYKKITLKNKKYFKNDVLLFYPYMDIVEQIYHNDNFCSACLTLIKSQIAKSHSFSEDISIGEDFLFFTECMKDSKKMMISNSYKYNYVLNMNSATMVFNYNKYVESIKGLVKVVDKIDELLLSMTGKPVDSSEKLMRNITDYFSLCYQTKGTNGVQMLKKKIKDDELLWNKLNSKGIDVDKISTFTLSKKVKLLIKKEIKKCM